MTNRTLRDPKTFEEAVQDIFDHCKNYQTRTYPNKPFTLTMDDVFTMFAAEPKYKKRILDKIRKGNYDYWIKSEYRLVISWKAKTFFVQECPCDAKYMTLMDAKESIRRNNWIQPGEEVSEEHRKKLSDAKKGTTLSQSHKDSIAAGRTGSTQDQATKDKISAKLKGITRSPESIAKQKEYWRLKAEAKAASKAKTTTDWSKQNPHVAESDVAHLTNQIEMASRNATVKSIADRIKGMNKG